MRLLTSVKLVDQPVEDADTAAALQAVSARLLPPVLSRWQTYQTGEYGDCSFQRQPDRGLFDVLCSISQCRKWTIDVSKLLIAIDPRENHAAALKAPLEVALKRDPDLERNHAA